jgi:DNA polymerase III epsilon subunit family exonuclease
MLLPPNLCTTSWEVEEAIDVLRAAGGRARVEQLAEAVFQIPDCDSVTAAHLFAEFLRDDWRISLNDADEVELTCEDSECLALAGAEFVVFDVETTGPKRPPDRVVEIGACRVRQGRIVAEFETLVNPRAPIPPFISTLTGISDAMVSAAPGFEEVAAELLGFIGSSVLVAHNAAFDVSFINHEIGRLYPGRKLFNASLCTVQLSRRVVPGLVNHRLDTVAEHFSVGVRNRHRAAGDARATAEVFIRLLELLDDHGVRDLAGARAFRLAGSARGAPVT